MALVPRHDAQTGVVHVRLNVLSLLTALDFEALDFARFLNQLHWIISSSAV